MWSYCKLKIVNLKLQIDGLRAKPALSPACRAVTWCASWCHMLSEQPIRRISLTRIRLLHDSAAADWVTPGNRPSENVLHEPMIHCERVQLGIYPDRRLGANSAGFGETRRH
jgi:hypothetical protein